MVAVAQRLALLIVDQAVVGSNPISHPIQKSLSREGVFCVICWGTTQVVQTYPTCVGGINLIKSLQLLMPTAMNPYLITSQDMPSIELVQMFASSSILFESGLGEVEATFDLTIREMPGERNFLLASGIDEIVTFLKDWKYDNTYTEWLLSNGVITQGFAEYLQNYTFTGDVWAIPEGTPFFPGEPVVRISAPLIDANTLSTFITNAVCFPVLYFSKAARVRLAARGKSIAIAGGMRANGFENLLKLHRLAYILGSRVTMPTLLQKFGIEEEMNLVLTINHALIKAFPSETEAYEAILNHTNAQAGLLTMIDTYNLEKGIEYFIQAEKEAEQNGRKIPFIFLDSGDLLEQSRWARQKLDEAGLPHIKLLAASNLNEYSITTLEEANAPIDAYAAATEIMTSSDGARLEGVYKLAEMIYPDGSIRHMAKLTPGKESLPGRKQIFRKYDSAGVMIEDIIGLETENIPDATPILRQYMAKGAVLEGALPELPAIREYTQQQLGSLPAQAQSVKEHYNHSIQYSPELTTLIQEVREAHS